MAKARSRPTETIWSVSQTLGQIAPVRLAAEWDNVGLLVGSARWPCRRALVTVDLTPLVLNEARKLKCDLIVSYHPPIFKPVKSMLAGEWTSEGLAAEALANKIAIYSPHTAWDAAAGGTNDTLAALCGVQASRPFTFARATPFKECKFVVFVPSEHVDRVADAMFGAGAGDIGNYTHCSFRSPGEGSFFGNESTDPKVGQRGRLERVSEIRLEAIAPEHLVTEITQALRRSHPYEEPAFDIFPLSARASPRLGQGRIGRLPRAMSLANLAALLRRKANAKTVSFVGSPRSQAHQIYVCVGAAGSLPFDIQDDVLEPGDVVITGEIRHHDALRYLREGTSAIALGHWASERPGVAELARRLKLELPRLDVRLSKADRDPFSPA